MRLLSGQPTGVLTRGRFAGSRISLSDTHKMLPSAASLLEGSFEPPGAVFLPLLEETLFCDSGRSDAVAPLPRALELLTPPATLGVSSTRERGSEHTVAHPPTILPQASPDREPWVAVSSAHWPTNLLGYDSSPIDHLDSSGGVSPNLSKSRLARRWLSKFDDLDDSRSSIDLTHLGKVLEDEPSPVSIVTCFAEWPVQLRDPCA